MFRVLNAAGSRILDGHMSDHIGQSGMLLMENAARVLSDEIMNDKYKNVLIVCGSGNNGGDGIALYRILMCCGVKAKIVFLSDPKNLTGEALKNFNIIKNASLPFLVVHTIDELLKLLYSDRYDTIIDAIFGTGLTRPITGLYEQVIMALNDYPAYRLAVDIPSGVNADTGEIMGVAFRADKTVAFQTAKRGSLLFPGREYTGELIVRQIGLVEEDYTYTTNEFVLEHDDAERLLPKRPLNTYKTLNGKGLLIAGSHRYTGAAVMSASSALRSGIGLLKVLCPDTVAAVINVRIPAAMTIPFNHEQESSPLKNLDLNEALKWADAIAIGPGTGNSPAISDIIRAALLTGKPIVLDADALNAIAKDKSLIAALHKNAIITPHIGEMQRLTEIPAERISKSMYEISCAFARAHNVNVLLKGATTVIANANGVVHYNLTGNPGLAKGGSGDVLTGIILGLICQGLSVYDAGCLGAYILGRAADKALISFGERAMLPTDVINSIYL